MPIPAFLFLHWTVSFFLCDPFGLLPVALRKSLWLVGWSLGTMGTTTSIYLDFPSRPTRRSKVFAKLMMVPVRLLSLLDRFCLFTIPPNAPAHGKSSEAHRYSTRRPTRAPSDLIERTEPNPTEWMYLCLYAGSFSGLEPFSLSHMKRVTVPCLFGVFATAWVD